jgi:cell division protease FtsH
VAEEIRFGDVTTGASNDLERVTGMARAMITQWGMSEKLGPIRYGEREELMFLNRSFAEHRNYSDMVAQQIDEEIHRLVEEAHQRCHQLLGEHWDAMIRVADRLLEVETINADEFAALMRNEEPRNNTTDGWRETENQRRQKTEGPVRGDDKRTDGLDLTGPGRLPQPA